MYNSSLSPNNKIIIYTLLKELNYDSLNDIESSLLSSLFINYSESADILHIIEITKPLFISQKGINVLGY